MIQHYVDIWSSNQTEEEFKQVLDSMCRTLGQPERIDRCLHIVDDYYIPFFNYLIHEVNPRTACATVGLCGAGGFMKVYINYLIHVYFLQMLITSHIVTYINDIKLRSNQTLPYQCCCPLTILEITLNKAMDQETM